jgi:short-subunit dehydrogenase
MLARTQVNNAAQLFPKPVVQCTAEDFSRCMATNLLSCFHLCQLAHRLLLNASLASGGSVVNVSSIGSLLSYHDITLYGTAKGISLYNFPDSQDFSDILISEYHSKHNFQSFKVNNYSFLLFL